ncbi:MAG: abortive infection family protein [Thiotrichales bacterium]|jgi:hypothetical protein|nr:abortive infection family protein [Thiotrichales bacterium]MBT3613289.1 abortive infection family protein [Thiotrichales bacterium]MBT3751806.1 abortive infection family protein [Thiotrichales bacterium]MBT3838063.1 abortive infection family protein [Thiotrichales bacterium]MBT4152024.1 abortive infection family protein [Thiotrichales bacterium]
MSDLSNMEKRKLERALQMDEGYVLEFSNKTFNEFMNKTLGIEIYEEKYLGHSGSKASRMRAFWDLESNYMVAKAFEALVTDWDEYAGFDAKLPSDDFIKIMHRLKESAPVPDISVIQPNSEEKDFEALAKAVREAIEKNEPEAGLDRLHTYLIKYFRTLCTKHGVTVNKDKPLHSLVGEYIKAIKAKELIESEITERILKSTISVMEAFNKIRNHHSFAHDNDVLNYHESLLIYGHITSSIRFIETIEIAKEKSQEESSLDDIPF